MENGNWTLRHKEVLREYRTVKVFEHRYHFAPRNSEQGFVVCDSADWVLIIPVTEGREVVFVRQFRHALGQVVLEIPGGVMELGEKPVDTAARELAEETGYMAKDIKIYGPLLPNPALNTARCHIAVATGCRAAATPTPDPFEEIEVELRPLSGVAEMIRRGELQHALCIAAFAISGLQNSLPTAH